MIEAPGSIDGTASRHSQKVAVRFVRRVFSHLLNQVPYEDLPDQHLVLPPRQPDDGYVRPPRSAQRYVPQVW
ncbi:MAG: hypothetical protein H0V87_11485 [Chloroflexi bacterium]|nr:hypothetical protein [Chloroflexota bacterium]